MHRIYNLESHYFVKYSIQILNNKKRVILLLKSLLLQKGYGLVINLSTFIPLKFQNNRKILDMSLIQTNKFKIYWKILCFIGISLN